MLKIRLQRVGRKHEPTFRVVLTDSKNSTKSGRFNEILGSYDPRKKTEVFKGDRIKALMATGAQLSGTVHNLLISHKVIEGKKKNVLPYKKPFKSEAKLAEEAVAAQAIIDKKAADEKAIADAAAAKEAEEKAAAEALANPAPEPEAAPVVDEAPTEVVAEAPEEASLETPVAKPAVETPAPDEPAV